VLKIVNYEAKRRETAAQSVDARDFFQRSTSVGGQAAAETIEIEVETGIASIVLAKATLTIPSMCWYFNGLSSTGERKNRCIIRR
jgi:hypothetical protein